MDSFTLEELPAGVEFPDAPADATYFGINMLIRNEREGHTLHFTASSDLNVESNLRVAGEVDLSLNAAYQTVPELDKYPLKSGESVNAVVYVQGGPLPGPDELIYLIQFYGSDQDQLCLGCTVFSPCDGNCVQ